MAIPKDDHMAKLIEETSKQIREIIQNESESFLENSGEVIDVKNTKLLSIQILNHANHATMQIQKN